jgi:glycosyltransferase involved in cell wall biosynthesis
MSVQSRPSILVLSSAVVGRQMSSLGIRSYQIARVLAKELPDSKVTLAVPTASTLPDAAVGVDLVDYSRTPLRPLAAKHDVLISYTFPVSLLSIRRPARIVLDMYGVYLPEMLEIANRDIAKGHRKAWFATQREKLKLLLTWADFVLYANERQRHLYLGMLTALGRVDPEAYDRDGRLRDLLGLAPFGVRPGEPQSSKPVLRGVHEGIAKDDKVVIWNGAATPWYDLETLLLAMQAISRDRQDIKLFFMGTELPANPQPPRLQGTAGSFVREAMAHAERLGVLGRTVFFNVGWVDYEEAQSYLLESDAGVCTYKPGLETDYSFRTRFLDLFWAERPVVCTQGDVLSEVVESRGLGITVPPGDVPALASALTRIVDDQALVSRCKERLRVVKEEYRWERVLQPLVEYCGNIRGDPDACARRAELARRLAAYRAARLWQLVRTRRSGPAYL